MSMAPERASQEYHTDLVPAFEDSDGKAELVTHTSMSWLHVSVQMWIHMC